MTTLLKVLKWLFGLLLALLILAFALLAGGANPIINTQLTTLSELMSEELGRPLKVERVDVRAFPSVVLALNNVTLGEVQGSNWSARRASLSQDHPSLAPFTQLSSVEVRFKLWRALLSMGQELELEQATLKGLHITLHRDRQGRWNAEEGKAPDQEGAKTQAQETQAQETQAQDTQPQQAQDQDAHTEQPKTSLAELVRALKLKNVAVEDLQVHVIDELDLEEGAPPRLLELATLNLSFPTLDLTRLIEVELRAALLGERDNLTIRAQVGPFDEWLARAEAPQPTPQPTADHPPEIPFPVTLSIRADQLNTAPLSPYLPKGLTADLSDLTLNGELSARLDPSGEVETGGLMTLKGVRLSAQPGGTWGPALTLSLAPKALVSRPQDLVRLEGFELKLNELSLRLGGAVRALSEPVPQLDKLSLTTANLHLGELTRLLPPLRAALPPQAKLDGPASLSLTTSGDASAQRVQLALNLTQSALLIPEALHKPSGVPLSLSFKGALSPALITLEALSVTASDLSLKLSGRVQPKTQEVELSGGVTPFSINNVVRLAPSVSAALPPSVKVEGQASLEFALKSAPQALNAQLSAQLKGANLNTPEAQLMGSGLVNLKAEGNPQGAISASLMSDLKGLAIKAGEAFDKPSGVPLNLNLAMKRSEGRLDVPRFEVHVASLHLSGQAAQSASGLTLTSELKPTPLGPLLALAPQASRSLAPALHKSTLSASLSAQASMSAQGAQDLSLSLKKLSFKAPKTRLNGELTLNNLMSAPHAVVQLDLPELDLDELSPPSAGSSSEGSPSEGSSKSSAQPSSESASAGAPPLNARLSIKVKRGKARGVRFKDLNVQGQLAGDTLKVSALHVDVFKGHISAEPLLFTLPNAGGRSPLSATLTLSRLNLERAFKELRSQKKRSIAGLLNAQLTLKGEGSTWEALAPTLEGQGSLSLKRGVLYQLDPQAAIINALAQKLPGVKRARPKPLKLKDLSAQVSVREGAIHLEEPVQVQTSEGPLELTGALGLNLEATLNGELALDPKRLSRQLKRPISHKGPLKVPFQVSGPLSSPKITGIGVAALVGAAALGLGGAEALKAADELKKKGKAALKRAEREARAQAKRAEREARAQAKRAEREARAKVESAEREARAKVESAEREARAKAKREKERLERKAKEKLKGLF